MVEVVDSTNEVISIRSIKSGFHSTSYVSPKFDGKIFLEWSKACTMALKSHKLMKYINGKSKQSKESDASFDNWNSKNAMICSWLFNRRYIYARAISLLIQLKKCGILSPELILSP